MKKTMSSVLILFLVLGVIGCGDKEVEVSPVRIEAKTITTNLLVPGLKVPIVEVASVVDKVVVKDVIANNGNCKMTSYRKKQFPKTLNYGEIVTAGYSAKCNLIKVEVVTDQGNWTVQY